MIPLTLIPLLVILPTMSEEPTDPFEPTIADIERWTGEEWKRNPQQGIAMMEAEIQNSLARLAAMKKGKVRPFVIEDAAVEIQELRNRLAGYRLLLDSAN